MCSALTRPEPTTTRAEASGQGIAAPRRAINELTIERLAPWILGALLAIGTLLRLVDLGALSFRWDEDLTALAVKAIAEHGIPELPSGMIYLRSLPFLYMIAASAAAFGFDEWGMRLPAVLFGIAAIPLVYVFGKNLFGTSVGLIVAALVTFSTWDIEFSRYARMYAPFMFFYVLTLLAIWRYLIVSRSTAGWVLCLLSAAAALSLHDLAYSLALVFLLPLLIDGKRTLEEPRRAVLPLAGFGLTAGGFVVWSRIQSYYFDRAAVLAAERDAADTAALPTDLTLRSVEEAASDGGPIEALKSLASKAQLPDLPAFGALLADAPLAALAVPGFALAAAAVFLAMRRSELRRSAYVLLPVIALFCAVHLFNLALIAALALAFVRREGLRAFRAPEVIFALALIAVSFVGWLALTVSLDLLRVPGGVGATIKEAIRQQLNYPRFFVFWGYAREYPLTTVPALLGGLWLFDRIARPRPDPAALFVAAALALPLVLNGMFESRYANFRYNVPFMTLFFVFVALGILKWREVYLAWCEALGRGPGAAARWPRTAGTALLIAIVAVYDFNPMKSWLVARLDHSEPSALQTFFGIGGFRDFRSTANYVETQAAPGDTLMTFECREYYNYLGRMDYCIVSNTYRSGEQMIQTYVDDGIIRDLYVDAAMILDLEALQRALADARGDTWLLVSDVIFRNPANFPADVVQFLAANEDHIVYRTGSRSTMVYRF